MAEAEVGTLIEDACRSRGVCVEAIQRNRFRILPPLTITDVRIDRFVSVLDEALGELAAGTAKASARRNPCATANAAQQRKGVTGALKWVSDQPRDVGEQTEARLTSWYPGYETVDAVARGPGQGGAEGREFGTLTGSPLAYSLHFADPAVSVGHGVVVTSPQASRDSRGLRRLEGDVSPTWASGITSTGSDASGIVWRKYCRHQKKLPGCRRPGRSLFDAKARSSFCRHFTRSFRCNRRYSTARVTGRAGTVA